MNTTKMQARYDSRFSSTISSGMVRKTKPPCTVTNADGVTIVSDKKSKSKII